MIKQSALVSVLLLSAMVPAFGQKLYISHTGDDLTGNRLTFALKEQIRRSATYVLVDDANDALLSISLVSLDTNCGGDAVSAVFSMPNKQGLDYFVDSVVLTVRSDGVDEMASTILADIDKDVTTIRAGLEKASHATPTSNSH